MCGIAGILTADGGSDLDAPLRAMQRALEHRGPDDRGLWRQREGLAHFAHTRLSILDLSPAGHQPMSTPDGRLTIAFNGEIFDFHELRAGLERDGVAFRTATDTEVVLRLYERHGANCVSRLRGMFAFAIWDELEHTCFLARDRFGIKPLYFAEKGGLLVFASELRALLESGLVERRTDAHALSRYFQTGSVPEPLTLVRDVRMLEAGHSLLWRAGKTQSSRWWQIGFAPEPSTAREGVERTRAALLDSVEHHFVSDVPVGIFLSGGVDSTALLALAHATGRRNIQTFSVGVDDAARDESALARRTAEHFGMQHAELPLDAQKGRELFAKFLDAVDQPTIDGFNTFTIAALAREHGMKVVLSGLGGDELFGGYPSFAKLPGLLKLANGLGPLRASAGRALEQLATKPQFGRLGCALREGGSLEGLYDAFRGVFSAAEARRMAEHLTGEEVELETRGSALAGVLAECPTTLDAVSALETCRYMRNQLLRDSDVMSLAHGLELRVPFVDGALFDAVASIPAARRLRPGKALLLDAVPELPDWIRRRPKSAFLFPYAQWLATPEWQTIFADSLRDLPVPTTSWYQRWSVFVFRHWQQRWLRA